MLRRVWGTINRSVRYKLLVLVLVPILLVLPLILGLTLYWFYKFTYSELYAKVGSNLDVAEDVFYRLQNDYLGELETLVESYPFQLAFAENDQARIDDQLELMLKTTDFDYLNITQLGMPSYSKVPSPLLENALRVGKPGVGIQLFYRDDFIESNPALAERMYMKLINTPHSAPKARSVEDRAMVVRAVYPIKNHLGNPVAVIDGGVILNGNFTLVDEVRDLVYGEGSLPEGGWGTVTVFLDDVRISTNVPLKEGERALGTRVSEEVRDHVLGNGKQWINRAFVVNDWYISAYRPLLDVNGERVGMLYTGFLESPYSRVYTRAVTILVVLIALTGLVVGLIVVWGAKTIFHPIELMSKVARATQRGEDVRVGELPSRDEIGELAAQFDSMIGLLKQRNQEIEKAAEGLEREVEERTQELKSKNEWLQETVSLLRETRHQLSVAGKLAALGQLTAGVAHEINNPTAVILGNIDILSKELGDGAKTVQVEVDLIIEQVYRIRSIVDKLLKYARPMDTSGSSDEVDVDSLVESTLKLVEHELSSRSIELKTRFKATNRIRVNPQDLQQVLINLLLNAVQASSERGVIECRTSDSQDGVRIVVQDDGVGIAEEDLDRVFDPFYTTKPDGTGLGLSVSYSVVRQYGGTIRVESKPGRTVFTVDLPCNPVIEETEALLKRYA